MMLCPLFRWDKSKQDSWLQIVWLFQKLPQYVSGVKTSFENCLFDQTIFKNRTLFAFSYGVESLTPKTKESKELKDFQEALMQFEILTSLMGAEMLKNGVKSFKNS